MRWSRSFTYSLRWSSLILAFSACSPSSSDGNSRGSSGEASGSSTGSRSSSSGSTGSSSSSSSSTGSTSGSDGFTGVGSGSDSGSSASGGPADASVNVPDASSPVPQEDTGSSAEDTSSPPDSGSAGTNDGGSANPPPIDAGVGWDTVPAILARIIPPTFPNLDCDITQYGGVGDGNTDNTSAFSKAIADCASRGGGRVVVPAGTFLTGPIEVLSHINLYVSAGATIRFSTDPTKYLPVVKVSWEGSLAYNYRPLVWAHDATNVAITGTGTIDGNATTSNWYAYEGKETPDQTMLRTQNANGVPLEQRVYGTGHYLRPDLIEFMNCTNVLFDGFTAKNSPFWTIHPVFSKNVTAQNFHSLGNVVNTDGFDPEACTDVHVNNATIQVGDDAIAIKAGRDRDGWTYYGPTQNVVIEKSTFLSKVGGISIGSEMSGGVSNVYVQDCTFSTPTGGLEYAFFIKAAVQRGGYIENVYGRRLTVENVQNFLNMTGHYYVGAAVGPTMYSQFSNLNFDTATVAKTTSQPFLVAGADATKLARGINLSNITVTASGTPALAPGSGHYTGLMATNVVVNGAPFNPPPSAP